MPALEFCVAPAELPRVFRQAPFTRRGGRPAAVELVWHDTAAGDLAADHLSLCEAKGTWRLERASPRVGEDWPPGTPAPLVAAGADADAVATWPAPLMPIAGFRGQQRTLTLGAAEPATMVVLDGALRGVAQEQPACRIVLTASATLLLALSRQLADTVAVAVPRWSLATEATCLARGLTPPPRRVGSPAVPHGATVSDAVAGVIGHLTDVVLAGVPDAGAGGRPEPVHAMRVAVRRLRSALSIFQHALPDGTFDAAAAQLRDFAAVLGGARDWDVFLDGTGHDVAAALPDDARVGSLLAAADKRRAAGYAALRREFESTGFRQLAIGLVQLAALRPWELDADDTRAAALAEPAFAYGAVLLAKQRKRMLAVGADVAGLPVEALHRLRKQGKRLRYAAEFFPPQHGRRDASRFLRRLSALQEALGHLNDGSVAADLMATLPGGGPDRSFAIGAVQGFAAARSVTARADIARAWSKFRKTQPFWA